jgi:hypothetical protein
LALVSLLVVLVALGVHGHFVTPTWHTRSKTRDVFVAAALEAVVVTLLLFLWARSRSARPGDQLEARLRTALLAVLGTVAVALTATGLLFAPGTSAPGGSGPSVQRSRLCQAFSNCSRPTKPPSVARPVHFPFLDVAYGLAAALVVAALVAVAVWAIRTASWHAPQASGVFAEEHSEAPEDVLEVGRRAMLGLDDARAAIIACYVAMEERLARAGTSRLSSETPDEFLSKVASELGAGAGAAARLTSLFYEARFSSHSLDQTRRAAAERALAELVSELRRAQPVPIGAEP